MENTGHLRDFIKENMSILYFGTDYNFAMEVARASETVIFIKQSYMCFKYRESGARFTKHLKPKIFLSSIQTVWNLGKS